MCVCVVVGGEIQISTEKQVVLVTSVILRVPFYSVFVSVLVVLC
jgi:hypothetical protein